MMKPLSIHRITPILDQSIPVSDESFASTSPSCHLFQPQEEEEEMNESDDEEEDQPFYDLVIIGSGPAALSLITRLLESRPASLYTEDEQHHLHWLHHKSNRPPLSIRKYGTSSRKRIASSSDTRKCRCLDVRILVIDKIGEGWLGLWNRFFNEFGIEYLRSPMFFHPDPSDLDSLVAYSQENQRNTSTDLMEIPGVVGREISKHYKKKRSMVGVAVNERDRKDYFTPSTKLFGDFVQELVDRYQLPNMNKKKERKSIKPEDEEQEHGKLKMIKGEVTRMKWSSTSNRFRLQMMDGKRISTLAVVSAVGNGGMAAIPSYLLSSSTNDPSTPSSPPPPPPPSPPPLWGDGWCHSSALINPQFNFPPPSLQSQIDAKQSTTLVVIGGGLTSAQLVTLALKKGVSKVILLLRGHLKVKPFDVGLEWMGRYANLSKMTFWQNDDPSFFTSCKKR